MAEHSSLSFSITAQEKNTDCLLTRLFLQNVYGPSPLATDQSPPSFSSGFPSIPLITLMVGTWAYHAPNACTTSEREEGGKQRGRGSRQSTWEERHTDSWSSLTIADFLKIYIYILWRSPGLMCNVWWCRCMALSSQPLPYPWLWLLYAQHVRLQSAHEHDGHYVMVNLGTKTRERIPWQRGGCYVLGYK